MVFSVVNLWKSMSVGWLVVVVSVVTHCWPSAVVSATCPWEEEGLSNWSASETWGGAGEPPTASEVTIPAGRRVLLDVQPASLTSLTIEEGAALIWGDVDGLELNTHYIFVKGEFLIGSQSCRFEKEAKIRLHGRVDDDFEVNGFGRKFIGVAPGATLEMHGQRKTPWTKLAQTVRPIKDVDCAVIYDHTNFEQNKARLISPNGLNVLVWNQDGSFMDFSSFKTYGEFPDFFGTIPEGKVVAMYAYGDNGIGTKKDSLVDTIVSLGGTKIRDAPNKARYSFIGRKGSPDTVKEVVSSGNDGKEEYLNLDDTDRALVFQVALSRETVKQTMMFRVLHFDAAYPKLTLVDEVVGWEEGDEVLLTSTDFDWKQAETRRIVGCDDCTPQQVRINAALTYMHYGNFTFNVDERGEVALLTRKIVVDGVMESTCNERTKTERDLKFCTKFGRDMFGAHVMVVRGFRAVHIRAVRLQNMGQQMVSGRYPIHFHMCDDVTDAYVRENVVYDSRSRCITVHGTNKLEVSDNVCYLHHGHGLFLEDAVEQENIISGNLIVGSKPGTLLLTDMEKEWCDRSVADFCRALSSFWLTHPNNYIRNNVAAGGEGIGYIYVFADLPLGPSRQRQAELNRIHHPKDMPLFFDGNVAHSNKDSGLHIDDKISTGTGIENKGIVPENGLIKTDNEIDPHVNGNPVWVHLANNTFYKNIRKNIWVKGGNLRLTHNAFADSRQSLTGGTSLTESGVELHKCLFIGESENVGEPSKKTVEGVQMQFNRSYGALPTDPLTATSIYQGPILFKSCFFDQYYPMSWCLNQTKTVSQCRSRYIVSRDAGAISFQRGNTYPTMTSTYAVNNTFGFCDDPYKGLHWVYQGLASMPAWDFKDGNKAPYLLDKDGKLTGTVNASIVANFPLFSGDECQQRPGWNLQVCPYRYVKMEIKGNNGNLSPANKNRYPLIIQRDDSPYDEAYSWMGEVRNEFLLRTHRSYIVDFNKNLDNAAFPDKIIVYGYGVERGDVVRVGICQPMDVIGFDIRMFYPVNLRNNATWVDNLAALDADTTGAAFFHDQDNGILFFKMLSFHHDTNETQRCPDGHCFHVAITPLGGTRSNVRSCGWLDIDSYQDNTEIPATPQTPPCPGIAKPEDHGPTDWSNVGFIEHEEFTVLCKDYDALHRNTLVRKGCFEEKVNRIEQELKSNEALFLMQTMSVDFCVDRCYHRQYQFAGLSRGTRCTCSNSLLETSDFQAQSSKCNKECKGDSSFTCGGSKQINVWTTGL